MRAPSPFQMAMAAAADAPKCSTPPGERHKGMSFKSKQDSTQGADRQRVAASSSSKAEENQARQATCPLRHHPPPSVELQLLGALNGGKQRAQAVNAPLLLRLFARHDILLEARQVPASHRRVSQLCHLRPHKYLRATGGASQLLPQATAPSSSPWLLKPAPCRRTSNAARTGGQQGSMHHPAAPTKEHACHVVQPNSCKQSCPFHGDTHTQT